ncbi:MAG TPA: hypothetical protein VN822_04205 [Candidatus Acidoferrales bacterium]|nr:hypothetical protein [Candidatus Acidoferrales bacterium]
MNRRSSIGALVLPVVAVTILTTLSVVAAQEPAAIPVENEFHHHVVLDNSYVRVLFVEIPAHESTLLHHHELPYVSVPPGGTDAVSVPAGAQQGSRPFRVGYAPGGMSHAVTNSGDRTLRNVAIELVRPQGTIRNRCTAVVKDQPLEDCDMPKSGAAPGPSHYAAFETGEILVEYWELPPNSAAPPMDDRMDMLVGNLTGVSVTSSSGVDSAKALRGGVLWIPAGSKPVFKTSADTGGHFITITFKDSGSAAH